MFKSNTELVNKHLQNYCKIIHEDCIVCQIHKSVPNIHSFLLKIVVLEIPVLDSQISCYIPKSADRFPNQLLDYQISHQISKSAVRFPSQALDFQLSCQITNQLLDSKSAARFSSQPLDSQVSHQIPKQATRFPISCQIPNQLVDSQINHQIYCHHFYHAGSLFNPINQFLLWL